MSRAFQGSTYPISKPPYKSCQEGTATHPFLHQLLEANHALAHALLVAKVAYECLAVRIGSQKRLRDRTPIGRMLHSSPWQAWSYNWLLELIVNQMFEDRNLVRLK